MLATERLYCEYVTADMIQEGDLIAVPRVNAYTGEIMPGADGRADYTRHVMRCEGTGRRRGRIILRTGPRDWFPARADLPVLRVLLDRQRRPIHAADMP